MHFLRLHRSGNAHWQHGAVSKVLREVSETEPHSRNPILLTYRRPELVSRTIETPSDDEDYTKRWRAQMVNTNGEST